MIWDKLFYKLRVSFYGMVSSKKVLSESSCCIKRHIYVVLEFLEVQSSVFFEFFLDEYFIEFWLADIMFQSPHATNFFILSTIQ